MMVWPSWSASAGRPRADGLCGGTGWRHRGGRRRGEQRRRRGRSGRGGVAPAGRPGPPAGHRRCARAPNRSGRWGQPGRCAGGRQEPRRARSGRLRSGCRRRLGLGLLRAGTALRRGGWPGQVLLRRQGPRARRRLRCCASPSVPTGGRSCRLAPVRRVPVSARRVPSRSGSARSAAPSGAGLRAGSGVEVLFREFQHRVRGAAVVTQLGGDVRLGRGQQLVFDRGFGVGAGASSGDGAGTGGSRGRRSGTAAGAHPAPAVPVSPQRSPCSRTTPSPSGRARPAAGACRRRAAGDVHAEAVRGSEAPFGPGGDVAAAELHGFAAVQPDVEVDLAAQEHLQGTAAARRSRTTAAGRANRPRPRSRRPGPRGSPGPPPAASTASRPGRGPCPGAAAPRFRTRTTPSQVPGV